MRFASLSVVALALGLFVSAQAVRAVDPAPTVGTVTGKLTDKKGNAATDLTVTATIHVAKAKKKDAAPAADAPATTTAPGLTAKSDVMGAFSIANVPPGTYDLTITNADGTTVGKSTKPVVIKGGDTVDAGTITIKTPKKPKA